MMPCRKAKGKIMAKEMSSREQAIAKAAREFKASIGASEWGKEEHNCFLCRIAAKHGMPHENIAAFKADIDCMGLGGNASQFSQRLGWRTPAAKDAPLDGEALLRKLGLAPEAPAAPPEAQ